MILAKILDPETGMMDIQNVDFRQGAKITELRQAGYLQFVAAEYPAMNEGEKAVETLEVVNGKIVQSWTITTE